MAGSVYMFNINVEEMRGISVRGNTTTDTISGWAKTGDKIYTPVALAVDRIKLPENKFAFAQGANTVSFQRDSNNGTFVTLIPETVSLSDDLLLYVARDQFTLMRTTGEVLETGSFDPTLAEACD